MLYVTSLRTLCVLPSGNKDCHSSFISLWPSVDWTRIGPRPRPGSVQFSLVFTPALHKPAPRSGGQVQKRGASTWKPTETGSVPGRSAGPSVTDTTQSRGV